MRDSTPVTACSGMTPSVIARKARVGSLGRHAVRERQSAARNQAADLVIAAPFADGEPLDVD